MMPTEKEIYETKIRDLESEVKMYKSILASIVAIEKDKEVKGVEAVEKIKVMSVNGYKVKVDKVEEDGLVHGTITLELKENKE